MRPFVLCVRTAVLVCFFSLAVVSSTAQSLAYGKVEAGIGVGPLIFLGDLGGNMGKGTTFVKDVNISMTNLAKGAYVNIYPVEWFGFRLAFNHGQLEGADSLIIDKGGLETYRKVRNLHFRSNLTEVYAAAEIYPTFFLERYEGLARKLRPYALIGIGVFKFNPQALYQSPNGTTRWVDLQPLRIEGQGMDEYPSRPLYKLMQMEIPMGFGAKYYLTDDFYIGMEILHRKTFTDYMDDVSTTYINPDLFDKYLQPQDAMVAKQVYYRGINATNLRPNNGEMRGQRKNNDSFFSSILRCGWRLYKDETPTQLRCPKF
jgi:hypothetical protein